MTVFLFVVLPVAVYVIGICCGRISVRRSTREQIRVTTANAQATVTGMQNIMTAESYRADQHAQGQANQIRHYQTMLTAYTEYAEGLADTAASLRIELTRYILGEVPEDEQNAARANLLTMTAQNETRARHVAEPLMMPDPVPDPSGTDFEAEDNYVAEGFASSGPYTVNAESFRATQIELARRHPKHCDCAYCIMVGD
jgi:hypothetical protein